MARSLGHRLVESKKNRRTFLLGLPAVDGRNPALPKKPWNDYSPANANKQWLAMESTWCRISAIHSMVPPRGRSICSPDLEKLSEAFGAGLRFLARLWVATAWSSARIAATASTRPAPSRFCWVGPSDQLTSCGCQNRFGIPFCWVGEFTTYFRT